MTKKEIIDDIVRNSNFKLREAYVQTTDVYPDYLEFKSSHCFDGYVFKEIFYHFVHGLKPIKCKGSGCDNKPKMEHFAKGFRTYCSNKCKSNDAAWQNKVKETVQERYGVDNPFQSDTVKSKIKQTNIIKYGVENPSQSPVIVKKANKSKEAILSEKYSSHQYQVIESSEESVKILCHTCNNTSEIYKKTFFSRNVYSYDVCTVCNPVKSMNSTRQMLLHDFIKENYTGTIVLNDRSILEGKEIDIYLPELNLAFEYNGLLWHSEFRVDKKYHLDKTDRALVKNIHLIHIWEDDWCFKCDIVKSRILNLLHKANKIHARKCQIKAVDSRTSKTFLTANHIQGHVASKYSYGLYYGGELVSLMTFGALRKNLNQTHVDGCFELLRFCNKLNYAVVGGASKLFKHFLKAHQYTSVISYADRAWSKGDLYRNLGFSFVHNTQPNYYYIVRAKRVNRWNYRKNVLVEQGFDKEKSERQIMLDRKIYRIYDSGSIKFIFNA